MVIGAAYPGTKTLSAAAVSAAVAACPARRSCRRLFSASGQVVDIWILKGWIYIWILDFAQFPRITMSTMMRDPLVLTTLMVCHANRCGLAKPPQA
jgi:hypothetical protein